MKLTTRIFKENREQPQINKIKNEKGKVTKDRNRIIRDYYLQLYANIIDNLKEMHKFLQSYNLPRLKQKEIEQYEENIHKY